MENEFSVYTKEIPTAKHKGDVSSIPACSAERAMGEDEKGQGITSLTGKAVTLQIRKSVMGYDW